MTGSSESRMHKRIPFIRLPDDEDDTMLIPGELLDEQQQEEVINVLRVTQIQSSQGFESAGRVLGLLGTFLFLGLLCFQPHAQPFQHALSAVICMLTVIPPSGWGQWLAMSLLSVFPFLIHVGVYIDEAHFLDSLTSCIPGLVVAVNVYIEKSSRDLDGAVTELQALRYGFKGA
ncbi:hypothetical protein DFJ77DRAFT_478877 [Powellomyces hirtus]|nr:hypothetical protein DFJ77DRAFT_478877 [Powellomyces hirtus]